MDELIIKKLDKSEFSTALKLVWDVFMEFEAPDYTKEGIDEFYRSINSKEYLDMLTVYAAFKNDEMLGVIATRSLGTHIALFFVDGMHHKMGIGRKLFEIVLKDNEENYITVNSSPFAVEIYHKFGFCDTDTEQTVSGLRFTPMKKEISK